MRIIERPRQMGKTFLLVLQAVDALRDGRSVLVITPTSREADHVKKLILDKFKGTCGACGQRTEPEFPGKLSVQPIGFNYPPAPDVVLIDNLDIVLARLIGQQVDTATVNGGVLV